MLYAIFLRLCSNPFAINVMNSNICSSVSSHPMHKNGVLSATGDAPSLSASVLALYAILVISHIQILICFLVHYRIVSFPVTACQHPEMDLICAG